uniref:Thrombomodulin-like n=1 Tax=Mastacembelus armatus TaxID=205130 RepID=A0A7N8XCQ8_9TELE
MKHVRGLYVVGLVFLMGRAGGIEPNSGYCIGNQCFTVFNDPSNFTTAQNQCRNLGGHLMTVRSSVSHDILFILLGNLTGQFWIGLHLPSGCPDAVSGLKGFQWVTKYSESDFFNWSPGFDSSCSCHRCVSVSPRSEFKWIQEPCGERAAGFLCEQNFTDTCKSLAVAKGESVTYMTPCEINNGGCEFKCTVSPKQDPCLALRCQYGCYNDSESYACMCDQGFKLAEDGRSCVEINHCADEREQCDQLCENTFGSYVCACRPGYTLVGQFRCVKSEDETHTDGKTATTPTIHPSPTLPHPDPTRQPSGVTTGALIGIIVFTVFFIVLVVFLVHHILCRRGKMESTGALKAAEGEAHGLEHVNAH